MVNSWHAQAFLSLQSRLMTIPGISWVDQDLGQLEDYETRPAVQWPCILIDFPDATYKEMGDLVEWGDSIIQLRIGFAPFSSANSAAPLSHKEEALKQYELEYAIFQSLHGLTLTYNDQPISEPLIRTRAATEGRDDTFRVRVLQFSTAFQDHGAQPTRTRVVANMNIATQ